MSIGTLWCTEFHPTGKVIRVAAAIGGLQIDLKEGYTHYETNKTPEFLSKFPHGKIPAFEGKDGFLLTETVAIARYVSSLAPNSGLLTGDPKNDALIDQWNSFAVTEMGAFTALDIQLVRGTITPYNKPIHQNLRDRVYRAYGSLNAHLANNTFLVGERLTLADLVVAAMVSFGLRVNLDAEQRKQFPHVIRHTLTVANQPKVKEIWGEVELIDKALAYTPPPKEKKEPAPKPEKAAPKPKKKAEEEDEDEDEKPAAEEPKAKHPCELLPKSPLVFDDWKRAYSNMDTRGADGALEWFYKNFDAEGYSIWSAKYKYPEDLTQVFMSSNLIGGFFNRLEASRKYCFGSLGVLGSANDSLIWGAFIVRGQDIDPVVRVAPDWESYEFKKIDLSDEKDKKFFEAALAWDLVEEKEDGTPGRAWADGKVFK